MSAALLTNSGSLLSHQDLRPDARRLFYEFYTSTQSPLAAGRKIAAQFLADILSDAKWSGPRCSTALAARSSASACCLDA
jgi:hypothetical protein